VGQLVSRALRGMNTDLHLTIRLDHGGPAERARAESTLDACVAWLVTFEQTCSRFLPDSELVALNAAAGVPFAASDLLFAVVAHALDAATETGGLFDPTILPALQAAGYTRSFDEIGRREVEAAASPLDSAATSGTSWRPGTWRDVQLDRDRRAITLPAGVALDLGGIAKGWAADELASRFLGAFPAYLIDLGGDLRVQGGPEADRPWIIGVADPRDAIGALESSHESPPLAGIPLGEGGIATSGDARRWWLRGGARQHHLIDPRTGRPALPPDQTGLQGPVLAWTALAPTATNAEVLAKVAYLRGYPDGLRALAYGVDSAGLCVFASGQIATTANLKEYLNAHGVTAV
jgi:thiamine biosynthesis lipoprotein